MELRIRDVARLLDVSERTVWRWADEGELPAREVNDQYRFNRVELLEWAADRRLGMSREIAPGPSAGLAEAIAAGGVFRDVAGADRDGAVRSIVASLPLPAEGDSSPGIDREALARIMGAQMRLASSAMGDGITLPHVRHPIVLPVPGPLLSLFFLGQPVDFGAPDGKPVRTVFTIVAPTIRVHVRLLPRLVSAVADPEVRRTLDRRGATSEIVNEIRRAETSPAKARGV